MQTVFNINEQLLDAVSDSILIHDLEGYCLYANEVAYKSRGYTRDEFLKMHIGDLETPQNARLIQSRLQELLDKGEGIIESAHYCKNKTIMPVEVHARIANYKDRKVIISTNRDISEHKNILAQLTGERNKLQSFINSLDCGLLILDTEFNILYQNSFITALYGNCLGKKCYNTYEFKDRVCDGCPVKLCHEDYKIHSTQRKVKMPDGNIIFWDNTASPIFDNEGKLTSVLELTRNITERVESEDELKSLQIQQQTILDNIPDMAWIKDLQHRFIAVNEALAIASGVEIPDMLGTLDKDYYPPDIAEKYVADDNEVMQSGKSKTIEEQFVDSTGRRIWIETIKTPIYNQSQKVMGITGIARDVSLRRQVEERLRASERRFHELADLMPVIAFEADLKGNLTYVNNMAFDIFGYTKEDFLGQPIFSYIAPEDRERAISNARQVLQGGYLGNNEYSAIRKDGSRLTALIQTAQLKNNQGVLVGLRGILVDISNQKKTEDELRQSELKFRALFEQSQDGIILLDSQGKVIALNPATENLFRFKREELLGKYLWENPNGVEFNDQIEVNSRRYFDAEVQKLIKTRKSPILNKLTEIELQDLEGNTHYCLMSAVLIELGNDFMVCLTTKDITKRKQMEERIMELYQEEKKQREELQEEAKARGLFIDVLAHELRTPLTPIIASSEMLYDLLSPDNQEIQQKLVNNVLIGARTLAHRLEELLDLARYSRGAFKLTVQTVEICQYIEEIVSRFRPITDKCHQQIEVEVSPDLKKAELDPSRMEQVIINLLSNASKFSPPEDKIIIRARSRDNQLLIEVSDHGIGISPDEQSRLFQPYHRIEQDRHKFPGLGLGLAVSRQIVESHKGKIWITSQTGKGSTFSFQIPLKQPK